MNERIKLIAEQATTIEVISGRGFDETQYTERFSKEKFAELIIQECIAQCWAVSELESKGYVVSECSKKIRKHFGVE